MNQSNKIKDPNKTANATDNTNQPNATCPSSCIITSQTFAEAPANRARTKIGAGEEVDLIVSPGPAKWKTVNTGFITRVMRKDVKETDIIHSIRIQALDKAGEETITATTATCECSITFTIVLPEKCYMESAPDTPVMHLQGQPSCGWFGRFYVLPNDVNFYNVYIRELNDKFKGEGSFDTPKFNGKWHGLDYDKSPDNASEWFPINTYDPSKGSFHEGSFDHIGAFNNEAINLSARSPVALFIPGKVTTDIRWQWTIDGKSLHDFPKFKQIAEIDNTGRCTISKGGHSETSEVNDRTTGLRVESKDSITTDPTIK